MGVKGKGRPADGSQGEPMRYYHPDEKDQCTGKSRITRERCLKRAMLGTDVCKTHGGKRKLLYEGKSIYSRRAKGQLKELLTQLEEQDQDERIDLTAEVDVMRTVAIKAVSLFQIACFPRDDDKELSEATKLAAFTMVQNTLKEVGALVEKCAKVAVLSEQILNPQQIQFIFNQLSEILRRNLEEDNLELFEKIISEMDEIKLISKQQSVTVII